MNAIAKKLFMNEWLRWIALPFAASIGSMAGAILVGMFMWFTAKMQGGYSPDGWWMMYVVPLFGSIAMGYLYTLISYEVAPRGKCVASTVMVTLLAVFMLGTVSIGWLMPDYSAGKAVEVTVSAIATTATAVIVLKGYFEKDSASKTTEWHA